MIVVTMNSIISKLRKKNLKSYYILIFCTILSVLLVTSYALMFFSPTVLEILPEGGDSRKQGFAIFTIAIIGCSVFTTYASSLFFKYKSREFGIFMALGEKKSSLKKVLLKELSLIISICLAVGIALSIPVSYGIWKIFQLFIIDTKEMAYRLGGTGILFGIGFCAFVTLCIFINGSKFVKKSNIIDIIRTQSKTEIVKEIKSWYGIVGWIFVVSGILLGYILPTVVIEVFSYRVPSIWSSTYAFSFIGVYMVMLHQIAYNKKGKNPKKYYKNIISTNMMRFTGKQTVKNMCVITFLIAASLFAAFYGPTAFAAMTTDIKNNPIDYSLRYKASENQITMDEIHELAKEYKVNITEEYETEAILLISNGYFADVDENGNFIREYIEKMQYNKFFSESKFNRISGQNLDVGKGEYCKITLQEDSESIWEKWNDLDLITHPVTGESHKVSFAGTVTFRPFTSLGEGAYVISDEEYDILAKELPVENKESYVLFNVENVDETYEFAKMLKNEIVTRSSEDVAVLPLYNEYEKIIAEQNGEEYGYSGYSVELSVENTQLFSDWKYYPNFIILNQQDLLKNSSVFIMLFIYIAVICFAATAVITYTRAITIGLDNKKLFMDLKKLGANNKYVESTIKKQLAKVFIYPTVVGSLIIYMLYILIFVGNSGEISSSEIFGLSLNLGIIFATALFMYGVYRFSLMKVKEIAEI